MLDPLPGRAIMMVASYPVMGGSFIGKVAAMEEIYLIYQAMTSLPGRHRLGPNEGRTNLLISDPGEYKYEHLFCRFHSCGSG